MSHLLATQSRFQPGTFLELKSRSYRNTNGGEGSLLRSGQFYPGKEPQIPFRKEAWRVTWPVWTWRTENKTLLEIDSRLSSLLSHVMDWAIWAKWRLAAVSRDHVYRQVAVIPSVVVRSLIHIGPTDLQRIGAHPTQILFSIIIHVIQHMDLLDSCNTVCFTITCGLCYFEFV